MKKNIETIQLIDWIGFYSELISQLFLYTNTSEFIRNNAAQLKPSFKKNTDDDITQNYISRKHPK